MSRRASLRIPCLLRRYTYSLGRALRKGEMADRCFCNQSCNLHEEADDAGFITERLFRHRTRRPLLILGLRLSPPPAHDGSGVWGGHKGKKSCNIGIYLHHHIPPTLLEPSVDGAARSINKFSFVQRRHFLFDSIAGGTSIVDSTSTTGACITPALLSFRNMGSARQQGVACGDVVGR
jgi:hypothetical protein